MKKNFLKKILSLGLIAVLTVGLTACSGGDTSKKDESASENKKEKQVVQIGAYGSHVPFNYMENDELVGYEVDIWKEIAKRNNLELKYTVSSDVAGLFTMLDTGKIDTILCQVSATEERAEKYDFTEPYMYSPGAWFVKEDSEDVNKIEDLYGKKVGVIAGGVDIDMYNDADPEGKIEQVVYSNVNAAYKDIEIGRLDATGVSRPQGLYLIKQGDVTGLKVTGYNGITETDIFPMLKGKNNELLEMANQTIKEMKEDGSLAELAVKWFGDDVTVNPDKE